MNGSSVRSSRSGVTEIAIVCERREIGAVRAGGFPPRAKASQKYGLPRPSWRASMCNISSSRLPWVAAMPFTSSGGQSGKIDVDQHVARNALVEHASG